MGWEPWPYIDWFSSQAQRRLRKLSTFYCNNINILLPFSSFKTASYLNVKDLIPNGLRSFVVYKLSCASCHACYIEETTRHFSTRAKTI